jgi:probable metal-binding protein
LILRIRLRNSAGTKPTPAAMTAPVAVHGHEIIDLVSSHPEGIRLSQLAETVVKRFGSGATFHTCSTLGMDLDALLSFLETRDKVRISNGVVHAGGSPACSH